VGSFAETKLRNELSHGKRLLSHERGNPDTEAGRSLNGENASTDASGGKRVRPKERTAEDPRGVRSAHSARKGHAGICAGAVWVTGRPTAMTAPN
jgi:hypothetical protein